MADIPPVLTVRVTPRMVESLLGKVARGAASTQGMALPAMKRLKSGFERLRALCGSTEVRPIHPFKLELRVSEAGRGVRRSLRVRSSSARTRVWNRHARAVFGEGAGEGRYPRWSIPSCFSRSGRISTSA
jgi:hypothetical protein